jgi:hypothetical protein
MVSISGKRERNALLFIKFYILVSSRVSFQVQSRRWSVTPPVHDVTARLRAAYWGACSPFCLDRVAKSIVLTNVLHIQIGNALLYVAVRYLSCNLLSSITLSELLFSCTNGGNSELASSPIPVGTPLNHI